MSDLRFAVLGCGFWAQFQIAAWQQVEGVKLVAVYNRTPAKAQAIADRFGVPGIYDDAGKLLASEKLDFVDIITDPQTHPHFVELAAKRGLPVICQKPMANTLTEAKQMVEVCQQAGVPLFIHENWRWQHPIRQLHRALQEGGVGRPFRARLSFCNSFPVFDNQPFLAQIERFILLDMGSHILDVARFLFGDASHLYAQTRRVNPNIKGEDVATVMMRMGQTTVTCELSYASRVEHDRFPETYIFIECENGSVELGPDFWVRTTTRAGTTARRFPPPRYPWADPAYDVVHSSIVACNRNLLDALLNQHPAETTGEDNLKTMQLVFAAYESAEQATVIELP